MIVLWPAAILEEPTVEVGATTPGVFDAVAEMMRVMQEMPEAAAIAGPQIGCPMRIVVYRRDPGGGLDAMLNPHVVEAHGNRFGWERCLSFPGERFLVERPEVVVVRGLDIVGEPQRVTAHDGQARMFAHEIDHLNGVLVNVRAKKRESTGQELML